MSIQDIIQSEIQKAAAKKKQEAAASTVATQKWSTTTPTVTETPKVTSTPKATQSVTIPTQTTPATSQIQTRQQQAKAQRQEELQQPTEPNLFQKAKTAFMWESNLSNINLFTAATPIAPAVIAAKSLESLKESDVWQTVQLATQSVKEWKTTVKDLFKQWAQSTYYWMLSYWTQFDKWLAWEALYRLQKVNPRMYEEFKKVWITEEAINNMFNDMQTYFDTQTKWWKRVTKLQEGWISLADVLAHWDVQSAIDLIWNQAWQMIPIIAWWVVWWWIGAFGMSFPVMAQESIDDYMNDPSITMNVSDWAIRNAALWAGALKAAIESLDTMFEFFWFGKWVPVKKWVMEALIKHKFASMWTEALEEMAQYEIDEIVAKLLGSDRDWTSFWTLVKDVWFEAALYSLFFPTWTVKWINQKIINKMYDEIEAKIREDIPDATPEQVQEIAKNIVERIFSEEKEWEKEETEEERLLSEALTLTQERTDTNNQLIELRENNWDIEEISDLELKLKDIETKLTDIDTKIWEIQKQQETLKEEELPAQPKEEQQLPKEMWWENLSEQTMSTIQRSQADVNRIMDSIWPKNKKIMNAKIKNEDKARYEQLIRNLAKSSLKRAAQELNDYSYDSLLFMLKDLENTDWREAYSALWQVERTINDKLKKIWKTNIVKWEVKKWNVTIKDFKDIEDLEKMWITLDRALMIRDFWLMTTENEKDLWWLKWVKIKDLEWKITDKVARKYWLLIANAADRLWIDWNKVIDGMEFSLVTAEWKEVSNDLVWTLWFNFPLFSKETIKEYLNKNPWDENLFKEWFVEAQQDLTKSVISLLIKWDDVKAERVLAHELIHLMELKYWVDNNLKIVRQWDYRWFAWILNWRTDFNTFNTEDTDGKNKIPDWDDYFYRDSEVWARYNEQYEAYRRFLDATNKEELTAEDQKIVNDYIKLTESAWYWTQEEFDKLIDERDRIMNEAFADYLLDEENKWYSDIMYKINDDLKWLSTQQELSLDNAHYKYVTLKREYQMIEEQIKNLSWDIKEEVRKWYDLALSLLESNYAMLVNNPKDYDKITTNTKSQQEQLDYMVNYVSDNLPEIEEWIEDINSINYIISKSMDVESMEKNKWMPIDKQIKAIPIEKTADKVIKDKKKRDELKWVWNGIKDVFTPALSRLYNINPRLAWAVHTYEARKDLLMALYKKNTLKFAKELNKLRNKDKKKYKELSLALFDYWMVDDIDIKEALKEAWIDPEIFNDVAVTLQQIAQAYKDAWLDITINDKYFPRKVKDYWLLLDYLSRKTWTDIKDKRKSLLNYIEEVNNDPNLSEGEKEQKIHSKLINEFTKPSERSNNAKERKLVLSEWLLTEEEKKQWYVNDITDFYEDPIKSLEMYIDDMVKKTELKKMLWWLTDSWKAISEEFEISVAWILMDMVDRWELTKEKADEAKHVIRSIINVKPSGSLTAWIKNATYSLTIANNISAAQQLEDISKTLLAWPTWFKNVIKTIIFKAWVRMKDAWLDNVFAQLEKWWVTDFNFKFSWFEMVDALGKTSFLNTAYDTCRRQANSKKRWKILYNRLTSMYWQEMWESMFNDYKEWKLKDWKVFNIDLMVDLLYQLWSTQPIYQSAMPTAYLNNPSARIFYCLYSFPIKQVDWLIQWTKRVYENQQVLWHSKYTAANVATMWCVRAVMVISLISSIVTDLINKIKWDEEETVYWKLLNEGWVEALKQLWWNSAYWALKIFSLSRYDKYIFEREWIEWVLMNKLSPASLSILNDFVKIWLWKKDVDELWKYWPLFIKPLYYIFKNNWMLPEYRLPRWNKKESKWDSWGSRYSSSSWGSRYSSSSSWGSRYSK